MAKGGLRNRLRKLKLRISHWYRRKPLPLTIGLALFSLFAGTLIQPLSDALASTMHLDKWVPAAIILLILPIILAILAIITPPQTMTISLPERIEVRRSLSKAELRAIRDGLHERIYGGVAPNGDEIDRMYEKNPRMGVALYHLDLDDFVAFATAWPLTEAAAKALISGERNENDLVADDILLESLNGQTRFLLIPAFGASAEEGDWQQRCYGLYLREEMRRALRENYFGNTRKRKITLIATGFSAEGERVCRSHGLVPVRSVKFAESGEEYPIFVGSLDRSELV
jgi:hypothetical protein